MQTQTNLEKHCEFKDGNWLKSAELFASMPQDRLMVRSSDLSCTLWLSVACRGLSHVARSAVPTAIDSSHVRN